MPDAQCIRRLVCDVDWPKAHEVTTVTPESPGIPRAMALRLMSCPPRRSGFFATVASGLRVVQARLGRRASTDLTPASRRQDNTILPYATASSSARRSIAHGLVKTRPATTFHA